MTDPTAVIVETLEVIVIESTEVGLQGPKGVQGEAGFTTGIDIISGGAPATNYTNDYLFEGGAP